MEGQTGNPLFSFPPNYWNPVGSSSVTALPNGSSNSNQYPHLHDPANYYWSSYYTSTPYTSWAGVHQDTVGPSNMYADESGNPLFFITNGYLYNAHGYLVDTLADTITFVNTQTNNDPFSVYWYSDSSYRVKNGRQLALGWSEVCVVPVPDICKLYLYLRVFNKWAFAQTFQRRSRSNDIPYRFVQAEINFGQTKLKEARIKFGLWDQ